MTETKRQHPLLYGKEYHLWRDGIYLGTATYTEDENVGDAFLKPVISQSGEYINEVYIADEWQLI